MRRSPRLRLAYRLGAHFGILHVERDILKGLTAKEFLRWEAYEQIEPFGEWRADVRAAKIEAMVYNMAVEAKGRKSASDFLLDWVAAAVEAAKKEEEPDPLPRKQTIEEQIAIAKMWVEAYNNSIEG